MSPLLTALALTLAITIGALALAALLCAARHTVWALGQRQRQRRRARVRSLSR